MRREEQSARKRDEKWARSTGTSTFLRALAFSVLSVSACKRAPATTTDASVTRIVSLSPSTTETLYAIGAGDRVVGRSRYCDFPPEVAKLPQVGGYVDPSFEAILALRPDLVTGARGPAGAVMTERLEARAIPTFFPPTESFAQIDAMILGLGEKTGNVAQAKATVAALDARIAGIEKAVAGRPRKRVLLVFGLEPLSVAGPASFADEMIKKAGGTNAVTEGSAYPTLGLERVIAIDPDVVVNAAIAEAHGHERIGKDMPGWSKVRAVVEGRIAAVTDEALLRPGPRIADGLTTLARAIHPDVTFTSAPAP